MSVPSNAGLGRDEVGSGRTGSEVGSSNGKRGSGVSETRVAPVLGTKTWWQR